MIPIRRTTYEFMCEIWGEALVKGTFHPAPLGMGFF